MPYITPERRREFLYALGTLEPDDAGELNYCFTRLAIGYMMRKGIRYTPFNDVLGALEGAKLEFYRRMVAPYENLAIERNGDAYPDQYRMETVAPGALERTPTPVPDKEPEAM